MSLFVNHCKKPVSWFVRILVLIVFLSGCKPFFSFKLASDPYRNPPSVSPEEVFSSHKDGVALPKLGLEQVTLTGLCVQDAESFSLSIADGKSMRVMCNAGTWTATIDLSSYVDGPLQILVIAKRGKNLRLYKSILTIIKDTTPPDIKFAVPLDPLVARGETIPIRLSIDGTYSGVSKRSYQVSWDGVNYETAVDVSSDDFSLVVPSTLSSTKQAKIKLFATDAAGNTAETISNNFQVMTKSSKLIGSYANARGSSFGSPDQARLAIPQMMASDGTYIYVSEICMIRRIKIADGVSDRLAGFSGLCESVDGIDGRADDILSLAVKDDWLYFTERENHVVRRVNKNQASADFKKLETFAGKLNTSGGTNASSGLDARFNGPSGLAIAGNFAYVTDYFGQTLRRIDLSTSEVTTLAGSYLVAGSTNGVGSTARFSQPSEIAFDNGASSGVQGSIFISDFLNNKIRRYDIDSGNVSDVIGILNQPGSLDGTGAAATIRGVRGIASDGTYLYLSDSIMHVIRRVTISSLVTTTIAGVTGDASFQEGNPSKLNIPRGMVVVGSDLYIADAYNSLIRKMNISTFDVSRWVGMPLGSSAEFHPVKSQRTGDGALIDTPYSVATVDGDNLYVVSNVAHVVSRFQISGNQATTIAGQVGSNGFSDGSGSAARFRHLTSVVQVGTNLYLADRYSHRIRMIDLMTSTVSTIAGDGTASFLDNSIGTNARFSHPWSIARSSDGLSLYVGEATGRRIRRVSLSAPHAVTTIAGDGTNGIEDNALGLNAKFENPRGMVEVGNFLYVTDGSTALRRIDLVSAGNPVLTVAGSYPTKASGFVDGVGNDARFNAPHGIAAYGQTLYIADVSNDAIRTYDIASGAVSTFSGLAVNTKRSQNGFGKSVYLSSPRGLAIHQNSLFVTTTGTFPELLKFDLSSGQSESLAGANFSSRAVGQATAGWRDGEMVATDANHRSLGCVVGDGSKIYAVEIAGTILSYNLDMTGETVLAGVHNKPGHLDGVGSSARLTTTEGGGCALRGRYLYFSQPVTNTIRRIDLTTREVSTIAGNAAETFGIVDGTGSNARLQRPSAVTILGEDLYFVDANGLMLRKIDLNSFQVTSVVGDSVTSATVDGVAPDARLEGIRAIAAHGSDIYMTSHGASGGTIRRFAPSTGRIDIVVGSATERGSVEGTGTASRFIYIDRISSDGVNLWISDAATLAIYKMRPSTLEVKKIYGKGSLREDSFGSIETTDITNAPYWVPGMGLVAPTGFQTAVFD